MSDEPTERLLAGLAVLDGSEGIPGAYCAKLLSDAGAEVAKLERPEGDPLRRWRHGGEVEPGEDGALFQYLHHGHRSSLLPPEEELHDLLEWADIVITSPDGPLGDPRAIAAAHPMAVVTSISPFGLEGPFADRPASELTVQAEGGGLLIRGTPDRPPLQAGGQVTHWVSGAYAAAAALAVVRRVAEGGPGALVDVSLCEVASLTMTNFFEIFRSLGGNPELGTLAPARNLETPSIERTVDGYVGFNTNGPDQFRGFLSLIGVPEPIEESEWQAPGARQQRRAEWQELVTSWTSRHTTADIVERAVALRVPVAPVVDGEGALGLDHARDRQIFTTEPGGRFEVPRRPWLLDGRQPAPPEPAPRLGQDPLPATERRPGRPAPPQGPPAGGRGLLEGVRVLDITTWWAGPAGTGILAAMGADVLHVESAARMDGVRLVGAAFAPAPQWWERSPFFLQINTNKRDVTLDLTSDAGRDLARRLVAWADIVVENYTPRVIERFELDWKVVHEVNPRAVMVRMPAFGLAGPWRDRPGFAQNMEQSTGMAWLTGWEEEAPIIQRGPCDPNGGAHAAFAALAALRDRDATGEGHLVEVPLFDSAIAIAAEPIVEWSAYGTALRRHGNRDPRAVPQGVYACRGTEAWLALSVTADAQWPALARAIGRADLASDPELVTAAGRWRHHDRIDGAIAAWAAEQDPAGAARLLTDAGLPASVPVDPRATSEQPQMAARRFFESVEHPVAGTHPTPGLPLRVTGVDRWIRTPAPTLGQHTRAILAEVCGCSPEELDALEAAGVIGDRPAGP